MRRGVLFAAFVAITALVVLAMPAKASAGSAVRFYGTAADDTDRIKLRIDNPPRSADVGAGDFTVEFWMKASLADNPSGSCDDWICGNIIFDRDIFGSGARDWGISMRNGRIYFGTGLDEHVLRGDQNVAEGVWHHVALTRDRLPNGAKCLYIDGALDVPCENGTTGDISYPDGYIASWPNDPFLVVGAEKHDVDNIEYPSFEGTLDEIRVWSTARTQAEVQANKNSSLSGAEPGLVLYWRLDEGSGAVAVDSSGEGHNGEVKTGTPGAAEWVASTAPVNGTGDSDGDGWSDADETAIGTLSDDACGYTPGAPAQSETWPPDLAESNSVNVSDVLALKPVFGTAVPPTSVRFDIAPSGGINVSDVLRLKPHFGASCVP